MNSRPLRLGISFAGQGSVAQLAAHAARAEQIGFDTVLLIDHLGNTAPLPPLVAIAAAAPSVRVGTLVINASFHRPALLTRDLASVDSATGGRLDIGLGVGYAKEEFAAAGLPFATHAARAQLLIEHISEIRSALSNPEYLPPPVQKPPPILVGGAGSKLLSIAAKHADIVAIASPTDEAHLIEQINYVKSQAGSRLSEIELSFGFFQVSIDRPDDLAVLSKIAPSAAEAELRQMVCLLDGTVEAAAERIQHFHDDFGITYFTFHKSIATSWRTLEDLVDMLR